MRTTRLLVLVWVMAAGTASAQPAPATDPVVAVVNGDVIRASAVSARRETGGGRTSDQAVLRALCDELLMEQAARAAGITVTEHAIDSALDDIVRLNRLADRAALADVVVRSGTTMAAYRDAVARQLLRLAAVRKLALGDGFTGDRDQVAHATATWLARLRASASIETRHARPRAE